MAQKRLLMRGLPADLTRGIRAGITALSLMLSLLMVPGCSSDSTAPSSPPPDNEPPPQSGPEWPNTEGVQVQVSAPPNGTHFVAGDEPVVWVALFDDDGGPLSLDDLNTANLYMYGPQEQSRTTTAMALLRASPDRNERPHHYIDLKTHPDVTVDGNVLSYPLSAVTDEQAGTYTVTVWARSATYSLDQWMAIADCQIKTDLVETQVIEREKCGACHLGTETGKFYLHHIDPGGTSMGNPSLDAWPVRTCKSCHNQDGYAAYRNGGDSGDSNLDRTADPIIRRVHGVHNGADLNDPFNNDPDTGDFRDYIHVEFPADVRNCTACHVDDRWKTEPTRQACTTCHDNVWFGPTAETPAEWENHPGGPQTDNSACSTCHYPDGDVGWPIEEAHAVEPPSPPHVVDLTMTDYANETHYVSGDEPVLTIVLRDAGTQAPIDHTTIDEDSFSRVYLFVSGPRGATKPVLTTAAGGLESARAYVRNELNDTWDLSGDPTFVVEIDNDGARTITAEAAFFANAAAATMGEVIAWLGMNAPKGIGDVATIRAYTSGGRRRVEIRSNSRGSDSEVEIHDSEVATRMGWTVGQYGPAPSSYARNDIRDFDDDFDDDPRVSRFSDRLEYALDDVNGLAAGTYTVFLYARTSAGTSFGVLNFQVGTAEEEPKVATSCTDCHGETRMHGSYPFNPDICKNCHDYGREGVGRGWTGTGGDSTSGWGGFGAMPLSRRVHGVHRGHYLHHPEEVKPPPADFSHVIFPQDIRNCTKCHRESSTWTQKPSRLACLACHDSDAANAHGKLMTVDPTPDDPWSGDEEESCDVCHGDDADFAPAKVHKITEPYVPPYPREAEEE